MDAVYLVRSGPNEELRYSLRSLRNLPHGDVWVFGDAPDWYTGNLVHTFQGSNKHSTTNRAIRAACEDDRVSDPFIMFNDDFYITKPLDKLNTYNRGRVLDVISEYRKRHTRSTYISGMVYTHRLLARQGIGDPLSYELHIPLIVHKEHMLEALRIGGHKRTVYGNISGLGGYRMSDVKVYPDTEQLPKGAFLSSDDRTFPRVRPTLEGLFPDPSPWE